MSKKIIKCRCNGCNRTTVHIEFKNVCNKPPVRVCSACNYTTTNRRKK